MARFLIGLSASSFRSARFCLPKFPALLHWIKPSQSRRPSVEGWRVTRRSAFVRRLFAAGGLEGIESPALADSEAATAAFAESGAQVAVLCAGDGHLAVEVAARLKERSARRVLLASHDEGEMRTAAIDGFVFDGCDIIDVLRSTLVELGVLR